jgi:carbon storage regulator
MLILSRKINECIVIDGHIVVKILRIDRDTVKLGIQAPAELPVHRQEIYDAIQRGKQQSSPGGSGSGGAGAPPASKPTLAHITPLGSRPDAQGGGGSGSNGAPPAK